MKANIKPLLIIAFFVIISIIPFWRYFLQDRIPFNGDYLVSAYEPFKTETLKKYPNGLPSKPFFDDQLRQYFPYLEHTRNSFLKKEFPFWNPYQFSGVPFAANWQTAVFFPTKILLFFLTTADYWSVTRMIPFFLSLIFTFIFLQSHKMSKITSIFGAVLYTFSGTFITYSQETIYNNFIMAFLPLSFFSIEKYFQKFRKKYLFILFLCLVLTILTGFIQQVLYLYFFAFSYAIYKYYVSRKENSVSSNHKMVFLVGTFVVSVIACLPFLVPGFQFYFQSARRFSDYTIKIKEYLLPYYSIFTFLFPDVLGNPGTRNWFGYSVGAYHEKALWLPSVSVFFSIYFIVHFFRTKTKKPFEKFFLYTFFLTLIFIFKNQISYLFVDLKLPIIGTAMFNRIIFINTFCLVLMTVWGFDYVVSLKSEKRFPLLNKTIIVTFLLIITAFLYIKYCSEGSVSCVFSGINQAVAIKNMIMPSVIILASISIVAIYLIFKKRMILCIFFLIAFFQGLYIFNKYTPFSKRENVYPENRLISHLKKKSEEKKCRILFLSPDLEYVFNDLATYYQIPTISGYDPLNYKKYNDYLFYLDNDRKIANWRRYDAGIANMKYNYDQKLIALQKLNVCLVVVNSKEKLYSNRFLIDFVKIFQYEHFEVWEFKAFHISGNFKLK